MDFGTNLGVLKSTKKISWNTFNRYFFMKKNSTLDYLNTISLFKKVFFFFLVLLLIFFCSTCYTYKYFCPADYTQSVLYKFNFIEYVLKIPKKTSWNTF